MVKYFCTRHIIIATSVNDKADMTIRDRIQVTKFRKTNNGDYQHSTADYLIDCEAKIILVAQTTL